MTPILPERLDWPSAVGNFILNFGALDWHVLVFLEARLPADEFAKTKGWHFQERIERVKSLLSSDNYSDEQKRTFEKLFSRIEPIRELRNHIAHGLLLVRLLGDMKTREVTLSLPKNLDENYVSETRHLKFVELTAALKMLAVLIDDFEKLAGFKEMHLRRDRPE